MSLESLLRLRFLIPGIVIILCWSALGSLTRDWKFTLPETWKDAGSLIAIVVPAALYYTTPLRTYSNRYYFERVAENIRTRLVRISGHKDDIKKFSWERVRPIFWSLIDNDKSLTIKKALAYNNGLIWTTLADVRIITAMFSVLSLLYLWIVPGAEAIAGFVLFLLVSLATLPLSHLVTKRHISIGNQQIEIIEQNYSEVVKREIGKLDV